MLQTGADVLLACLAARGLKAVFGMPGNQTIAVYDALLRATPQLPHYLIRHEQAASMLASGFIRAGGGLAAALTVPGPGATNAATAVLDADTDCVPLLSIVGGYDRNCEGKQRSKLFHGLDQEAFYKPFTRYFGSPKEIAEIPRVVDAAMTAMFRGRPGPAVIEISPDLAAEAVPEGFRLPKPGRLPNPAPVDPVAVGRAVDAIRQLQRPVVMVGVDCEAAGASAGALKLAELLGAPIIYGRRGKGVVSDAHRLVAGFTRSKRVAALLSEADGLIAIGTRFTQIDTRNWSLALPATVIQFDRDAHELGREYPIAVGVAGDLKAALKAACFDLSRGRVEAAGDWRALAEARHAEWLDLPAIPVLSEIRRALPRHGIAAVDVTAAGYNCFDRFPVNDVRSLIYPCHSVSLGFAFPAALGAKLACPNRPVVSLSGDGGFLMGASELGTAVEYGIQVVAVVVKDDCLSAIKGSQQQAYGQTIDTSMRSPDFVALAHSFGATGVSTRDIAQLPELIEYGFTQRGPTVIELRLENRVEEMISVIPWLHGE